MDFFNHSRRKLYFSLVKKLKKIDSLCDVPVSIKYLTKSFLSRILLSNGNWLDPEYNLIQMHDVSFKNKSGLIAAIDVQCLRNNTFFRGIGRYTLSLVEALARKDENTNFLLYACNLNGTGNIPLVKQYIDDLNLPNLKFCLIDLFEGKQILSRDAAEIILSKKLVDMQPAFVIVPSHFEHPSDAVHLYPHESLNIFVIVHDIIPWRFQKDLLPLRSQKKFYKERIKELSKFAGVLTVSKYSAWDVGKELPQNSKIDVIGGSGFNTGFTPKAIKLKEKHGILMIGAETSHKNVYGLLKAYSLLPIKIQQHHPLTIAGIHSVLERRKIQILGKDFRVTVKTPELLSDQELQQRFSSNRLIVVPSFIEGLSMPVMEGWLAGTLVIGSKATVLEEVIHFEELLFDPYSPEDVARVIQQMLVDDKLWEKMFSLSKKRLEIYNWDNVASALLSVTKNDF